MDMDQDLLLTIAEKIYNRKLKKTKNEEESYWSTVQYLGLNADDGMVFWARLYDEVRCE